METGISSTMTLAPGSGWSRDAVPILAGGLLKIFALAGDPFVVWLLFIEELKFHIRYHSNARGVAYAPWGFAHPA